MRKFFLTIIIIFSLCLPVLAQNRTKNLDLILLVDKSLSMVDKINDVKTFVQAQIFDKIFIPNDTLTLILFYGKQEVLGVKVSVGSPEFDNLKAQFMKTQADGLYTDIGSALDFTEQQGETLFDESENRKHFVLLTDGIQEAPPGSPYGGPKGVIHHKYLDSAKNIEKKNWKVQILGIGTETIAEDLAEDLSGVSTIWEDTQAMLRDNSINFFEMAEVVGDPEVYISGQQTGHLTVNIESQGLMRNKEVQLTAVELIDSSTGSAYRLTNNPFQFSLKNGLQKVYIPIDPTPFQWVGAEKAELKFYYAGTLPVTPHTTLFQSPRIEFIFFYIFLTFALVIFPIGTIILWNLKKSKMMGCFFGTT